MRTKSYGSRSCRSSRKVLRSMVISFTLSYGMLEYWSIGVLGFKSRFFRLTCEAGLGDCTAEARRARSKEFLIKKILRPLRTLCLCGEYSLTINPEEPKSMTPLLQYATLFFYPRHLRQISLRIDLRHALAIPIIQVGVVEWVGRLRSGVRHG